jgi:hypothetical protein
MDTYVGSWADFQSLLQVAVNEIPLDKLGVGLMTSKILLKSTNSDSESKHK